jgi:hypothetical protein
MVFLVVGWLLMLAAVCVVGLAIYHALGALLFALAVPAVDLTDDEPSMKMPAACSQNPEAT